MANATRLETVTSSPPKEKRRARRGRGEGSIYQRADGYWVATVSAGFGAKGKRRRRTLYGETKKAVQDKLKKEGLLAASGCATEAGSITLAIHLARWLEVKKTETMPGTHARYKIIVNNHLVPRVGKLRLVALAPVHVEQLYQQMDRDGISPRTRQLTGVTLSNALSYACRLKLIPHNPAREIKKPRSIRHELRTWTAEQASAFLKAVEGDRLHALYVLALATGMRQGELFALTWADVDFVGGYLTVRRSLEDLAGVLRVKETKTGKGRRIDLPGFAIDALNDHRRRMLAEGTLGDTVFPDQDGGYLRRPNLLRRSFQPAIERAGVPAIRFHDLRHTCATLLLAAGENVKVVSERLGHASIKITLDTYAHVLPGMQKQAADRLQKLFG